MSEDTTTAKRYRHYFTMAATKEVWTSLFADAVDKRALVNLEINGKVHQVMIAGMQQHPRISGDTSMHITGFYDSPGMEC